MHLVRAKTILSPQNGINVYRGCTHGCIYCDSRSVCYQMTHEFEDVEVKENAPALLEAALQKKRRPCMVATGSMSDPYQPIEETLCLTRQCLEVIERQGCGAVLLTKSARVLRDLPLLARLAKKTRCVVQMTVTTADDALAKKIEPNVSLPSERFSALRALRAAGIETGVWLCPVLPFLNDSKENLCAVLSGCFDAGVSSIVCFGMNVTLRDGSREFFYRRLNDAFPGLAARYERTFGRSYVCESERNAMLMRIFHRECENRGVLHDPDAIFAWLRRFPDPLDRAQTTLF